MMKKPDWQCQGQEPDYRFSLANERTFLAWIRTALALLAGGLVLEQFALQLEPRWLLTSLSLALALLAAGLSAAAYWRWRDNEIAMRHNAPLPHAQSVLLLAVAGLLVGTGAALLVLWPLFKAL